MLRLALYLLVVVPLGCDSSVPVPEPVRLNQTYRAQWFGSYEVLGTVYGARYTASIDIEETPAGQDGRGGTLRLSDSRDDFGRSTSVLLINVIGSNAWRFEPSSFSGLKGAPASGEAAVSFSGDLLFSRDRPISTFSFEGIQTTSDSSLVGTVTCAPALQGCETATVTFTPYNEVP